MFPTWACAAEFNNNNNNGKDESIYTEICNIYFYALSFDRLTIAVTRSFGTMQMQQYASQ